MQQIQHIDDAIEALHALKAECPEMDCRTIGRQVASYKLARGVAVQAHAICADLLVSLCGEAAGRLDADFSSADRAFIRDNQPVTDALYDADMKADQLIEDIHTAVYDAMAAE